MAVVEERYAGALLELAISEGKASEYLNEAQTLRDVLSANSELIALYLNPKITAEEKAEVTKNCFQNAFADDIVGLITLVVKNGRGENLLGILDWFITEIKDYLKIGVVSVESAAELTAEQKAKLEQKIIATTEYTTLEVTYTVKSELIGGVRIRIKDRILDNSIQTKLDKMLKELRQVQI